MVDMENYGSKSEIFDIDYDIENEATKAEVGDIFAIITKKLENGDFFC
jgi:hypothetical protein